LDSLGDNNIISGLKKGDESSFQLLIELYQDKVYNTCLGFVRNESDADDLTQEVFIEVFLKINTFRGDASISTWLYRIAVNKSLEFIRKQKRKKRFGFLKSLFENEDMPDTSLKNNNHPGIQLEMKELAEILFEALDKLPVNQKTAFTLHKIEGLSYKEISKVMGKSNSSIESILHRAKVGLRKLLSEYYKNV